MNNAKQKNTAFTKTNCCLRILAALLITGIFLIPGFSKELQIHMIDVWQGDSILVITPNNKKLLIDAGDLKAGAKVLKYLKKIGIKSLDAALLTHPHADHLGGFLKVLEKIKVEKVYDSTDYYTQTYKTFRRIIQEKNITRVPALRGDLITLDPEVKIHVLSPDKVQNITSDSFKQPMTFTEKRSLINNRSVVLRISYGKDKFFTSGDAEYDAEAVILKNYKSLRANLFKAGHHGSKTSSSQAILNKIDPKTILISVGKGNQFGHPHASTMQKFEKTGAEIYRTDHFGDVVMRSEGDGWKRDPIKEIFDFVNIPRNDMQNINSEESSRSLISENIYDLKNDAFEIESKIHFRADQMIDSILKKDFEDFNLLISYLNEKSVLENRNISLFVNILMEKLRLLALSGEINAVIPMQKLSSKIEH
jgi:competence protein ComEC